MSAPVTQAEQLSLGRIVAVGLIALVAFGLGIAWAFWILRTHAPEPPRAAPQMGRAEIGMVNQQMFELDRRGPATRAQALKRLHGYGWVNADAGMAHIPIEQAMDALVKEATP
jgi:hypothetical protein